MHSSMEPVDTHGFENRIPKCKISVMLKSKDRTSEPSLGRDTGFVMWFLFLIIAVSWCTSVHKTGEWTSFRTSPNIFKNVLFFSAFKV